MKDIVSETIWYLLSGNIILSIGENYLTTMKCRKSVATMKEQHEEWEEEKKWSPSLSFEEFIGDEINGYLMNEKGMGYGYLSTDRAVLLARNYINLDKILSDIYNF